MQASFLPCWKARGVLAGLLSPPNPARSLPFGERVSRHFCLLFCYLVGSGTAAFRNSILYLTADTPTRRSHPFPGSRGTKREPARENFNQLSACIKYPPALHSKSNNDLIRDLFCPDLKGPRRDLFPLFCVFFLQSKVLCCSLPC